MKEVRLYIIVFVCIIALWIVGTTIHDTVKSGAEYAQRHKVFVPDSLPSQASQDSIESIKPIEIEI